MRVSAVGLEPCKVREDQLNLAHMRCNAGLEVLRHATLPRPADLPHVERHVTVPGGDRRIVARRVAVLDALDLNLRVRKDRGKAGSQLLEVVSNTMVWRFELRPPHLLLALHLMNLPLFASISVAARSSVVPAPPRKASSRERGPRLHLAEQHRFGRAQHHRARRGSTPS